jgi:hypothetical protein
MSTKGIYDAIKAALPTSLQPVFLFGARKLSEGAGPIRIVMVPAADTYGARARQGGSQPQEIYGYQGDVVFDVVAPTHEAIDGAHGLRDLLISLCLELFPGSFSPVSGSWDLENGGAQAVRGEHYVLTLRFGQPVLRTTKEQASALDFATPTEAPQTGSFTNE